MNNNEWKSKVRSQKKNATKAVRDSCVYYVHFR